VFSFFCVCFALFIDLVTDQRRFLGRHAAYHGVGRGGTRGGGKVHPPAGFLPLQQCVGGAGGGHWVVAPAGAAWGGVTEGVTGGVTGGVTAVSSCFVVCCCCLLILLLLALFIDLVTDQGPPLF
jgi:hypothetical protein